MPKRPIRFFNTTGPCNPDDHYMLPPAERLQGAQLNRYINDDLYWMLHAPRQTGKTTFLKSWMREINAGDKAIACYVSVERCQGMQEIDVAMANIAEAIRDHAETNNVPIPKSKVKIGGSRLIGILKNWAKIVAPKKLVILFDEVDVLEGNVMVNFLRQLRDGFATRGIGKFPTSIALVGMRDLKDYLTAAKDGKPIINPGSPFNIKEDSVLISNFSKENVTSLFAQRTAETSQQITPEALDYVWEQSHGQPWIVNSLFKRATLRILDPNSCETVTKDHIEQAREQMILARETHLDALAWRLKDPRIRKVMETLMTGDTDLNLGESEGFILCQDLGLVVIENGTPKVANPIYKEVLARQMTYGTQLAIQEPTFRWQKPDGSLDMEMLLKEFQKFWRRHSEIWEEKSDYTEAFPHLLLMAFLQRITNGKGRVEREYTAGRGRMDLFVEFAGKTSILEIKLIRDYDSPKSVKEEGLDQIRNYRDSFDKSIPCYLLIFDRRSEGKKLEWDQRIQWNVESDVTVVGC